MITIKKTRTSRALKDAVEQLSGVDLSICFQCKKCSSGCPVAKLTKSRPSEIMRQLHLGAGDELLDSDLVWMCASCETCSARCPMGIDVAAVMDALRRLALERGAPKPEGNVPLFNRAFLKTVETFGRSYEIGMIAAYKLGTGKLMNDTEKFPAMLKKGKIALLPPRGGDRKTVKRIFKKVKAEQRGQSMRYAYYPGCSAESTARDMHQSTLAVARALGIDFVEPKGWTCCGATAGHQTDRLLAVSLPAANLAKVQDMKLDMVVNCAACYNRMKVANHEISRPMPRSARASARRSTGITMARSRSATWSRCSSKTSACPAIRKSAQAFAERPQGGLLLRLPAGPAAGDSEVRRPGKSDVARPAGDRDGRREPRLALQGRVLRRRPVAVADGRGGRAHRVDSRHGGPGGRRLHRGQLPDVPGES